MVKSDSHIYFDYAAATPLDPDAQKAMVEQLVIFGNPSSVHTHGREARLALDNSRKKIAAVMGVKPEEIIFTGSGTEANNLAILGIARAHASHGKHIITSAIEHPSVLRACQALEQWGFEVTYLPVNQQGRVDVAALKQALRPNTTFISIQYANSEIGTVQALKEIAQIISDYRKEQGSLYPFFHSDACQAPGLLPITAKSLGLDLMTLNSSKVYGPKGIACLFKLRGLALAPMLHGGEQEFGLRAGTESLALAAGFACALEKAETMRNEEAKRLTALSEYTLEKILTIPDSSLNGDRKYRLANNLNISFEGVDGEMLVAALDQAGFSVASGSACTATQTGPSHVLAALCLPGEIAKDNIRITLGRQTTKDEVDRLLEVLPGIIEKLRNI